MLFRQILKSILGDADHVILSARLGIRNCPPFVVRFLQLIVQVNLDVVLASRRPEEYRYPDPIPGTSSAQAPPPHRWRRCDGHSLLKFNWCGPAGNIGNVETVDPTSASGWPVQARALRENRCSTRASGLPELDTTTACRPLAVSGPADTGREPASAVKVNEASACDPANFSRCAPGARLSAVHCAPSNSTAGWSSRKTFPAPVSDVSFTTGSTGCNVRSTEPGGAPDRASNALSSRLISVQLRFDLVAAEWQADIDVGDAAASLFIRIVAPGRRSVDVNTY